MEKQQTTQPLWWSILKSQNTEIFSKIILFWPVLNISCLCLHLRSIVNVTYIKMGEISYHINSPFGVVNNTRHDRKITNCFMVAYYM